MNRDRLQLMSRTSSGAVNSKGAQPPTHSFEWRCLKCGEKGSVADDEKFWKFCPYCGGPLDIYFECPMCLKIYRDVPGISGERRLQAHINAVHGKHFEKCKPKEVSAP